MRYFLELAYNGAHYYGWQRQPDQRGVQETLEEAFSTVLRQPIEMTGCGRTDTGVHAAFYVAHFDYEGELPEEVLRRLNKFLPEDIALRRLYPVAPTAHARFDARYRAYRYHLSLQKDPFRPLTSYFFPFADRLDTKSMQEAAQLLLSYDQFLPFCKTGSDALTMRCTLYRSEWEFGAEEYVFHIAANRFLRGMVRLIVGMCLTVGQGQLPLSAVREALDRQVPLPKSLSVPPNGLFLSEVRYEDVRLGDVRKG